MAKERKVYTSFHDISPREYMYFPKGTIDAGKPGKFSRIEVTHILISMAVLTIAFALALSSTKLFPLFSNGFVLEKLPLSFLLSFLAITIGFFFHEISHKFMAQRYGLWAEYRMFPQGLLLAFILSIFTGFVFAAPGAVMFMGGARNHETGRIAMAGPLANIIIAAITLPIYLFVFYETELLSIIFVFICFINAFLATFNLLPFGPLDGVKIIRWSAAIWMIMLIISISLLMFIWPELGKIFYI